MFRDLIEYPIESERLQWEARQVIRDLYHEPHLLLRLKLTGTQFMHLSEEPFVVVGGTRSRFVKIAEDGSAACAYFDEPLPLRGRIEFGYGNDILLRFPRTFDTGSVKRLDPKKLPKNTKLLERFHGKML
jgi:hypothetical protein